MSLNAIAMPAAPDADTSGQASYSGGMMLTAIDPVTSPPPTGGYVNALDVSGARRLLFISGQIPQRVDGTIPDTIDEQCQLVWAHIEAALTEAGLGLTDLIKVTTYLADREFAEANTRVRNDHLRGHKPALTVIVTGIWDPRWLIEIEAVAAA